MEYILDIAERVLSECDHPDDLLVHLDAFKEDPMVWLRDLLTMEGMHIGLIETLLLYARADPVKWRWLRASVKAAILKKMPKVPPLVSPQDDVGLLG